MSDLQLKAEFKIVDHAYNLTKCTYQWVYHATPTPEQHAMTVLADKLAEALREAVDYPVTGNWYDLAEKAIAAYENHKKQTP